MNVVREISRINNTELDIAINNPAASWHEQYKDSAYIFIGGLPYDLTEGDVITIFSQYGEVVDANLPRANLNREKQQESRAAGEDDASSSSPSLQQQQSAKPMGKGKHRGFGFLMYEDQRSTVLAVDNLNGAQVLGRTLRVDHVASYKQPKVTDDEGNRVEAEVKSFNAAPQLVGQDDAQTEHQEQEADLEDPMASYFQRLRREEKSKGKQSSDDDKYDEKEEKRRRKEQRARIRAEREQRRSGSRRHGSPDNRHRSHRHPNDDKEREHKRHRSHRSHDGQEGQEQVNRYEQMKKSRSILDTDTPTRTERYNSSSQRRTSTSPSRDQERRHHHHSSSSSRRRSRSRSPR
ncbi:related to rna binding motif protein [Ustilago trichophora]|uniref:Related to rna binding motif protein n=1 Tax=Ustilago trichophora TaxID=86804 RepID=A0A5C3EJ32_9BASI|nr:related to rna binding motif protein [Ustilago trichophora]